MNYFVNTVFLLGLKYLFYHTPNRLRSDKYLVAAVVIGRQWMVTCEVFLLAAVFKLDPRHEGGGGGEQGGTWKKTTNLGGMGL